MASDLEVANLTCLLLGARSITDLEDPDDESAVAIKSAWELRRDACLRAHAWRFAIKRVLRTSLVATPEWGFAYEYQLPDDCLKVLQIGQTYVGVDLSDYRTQDSAVYRVEGQKILSHSSDELPLRYIARITQSGLWDATFGPYFAADLAETCCERITQSNTKAAKAAEAKKEARREALRANAIEAPPDPRPDNEWVLARMLG